jgi:hypothetical protein
MNLLSILAAPILALSLGAAQPTHATLAMQNDAPQAASVHESVQPASFGCHYVWQYVYICRPWGCVYEYRWILVCD